MEIIVVDGLSDDGSPDIARRILSNAPQSWDLVQNPERITPTAWNVGIERSRGDVIIVVIAHAELAHDYVRQAVAALEETGADCVGGSIRTVGDDTGLGTGIALALSSIFGVGGSTFRTRIGHSGAVDTVPFGAYRRDAFERFGLLDPEFVRNQDTEINFRITTNGGRIWMDRRLTSVYHPRSSLAALWRQHFRTGESKVQLFRKYGSLPALRHYIPGAFVVAVLGSLVAAVAAREPLVALIVLGPYAGALVACTTWIARRHLASWAWVFVALVTLHFSYGLGFLAGVGKYLRPGRQRVVARPPTPRNARR
jgi:glycosyltransferase involved in cell wall biosynthesis